MSDMMLHRETHLAPDSKTEVQVPFIWNGEGKPDFVMVSKTDIGDGFKFNDENTDGLGHSAYDGAKDGWGDELGKEDFNSGVVAVSGMDFPGAVVARSEKDSPSNVRWGKATVEQNGEGLKVTGYDEGKEIEHGEVSLLRPDRFEWSNGLLVTHVQETNSLAVSHPNSLEGIVSGVVVPEPETRKWTNGVTLTKILIDSTHSDAYDLLVSYHGSDAKYRLADSGKYGLERRWENEDGDGWIAWDESSRRWELKGVDGEGAYQYLGIDGADWEFGTLADGKLVLEEGGTLAGFNRGGFEGDWMDSDGSPNGKARLSGDNLVLQGTRFARLEYGVAMTGNWSGNTVVSENGSGLSVSGSSADADGDYVRFIEADGEDIYVMEKETAVYTISRDGDYWRLCTSADGVYQPDGSTGIYRTWRRNFKDTETAGYAVAYCRYDNKWVLRTRSRMELDVSGIGEGDESVTFENGARLEYDKAALCWVVRDRYGNVVTAQAPRPEDWEDEATGSTAAVVVNFENKTVVDGQGRPCAGQYAEEDFDRKLSVESWELNSGKRSYYVIYDMDALTWRIVQKVNLDGVYAPTGVSSLKDATWNKTGADGTSDESYSISYDSEKGRWQACDYGGGDEAQTYCWTLPAGEEDDSLVVVSGIAWTGDGTPNGNFAKSNDHGGQRAAWANDYGFVLAYSGGRWRISRSLSYEGTETAAVSSSSGDEDPWGATWGEGVSVCLPKSEELTQEPYEYDWGVMFGTSEEGFEGGGMSYKGNSDYPDSEGDYELSDDTADGIERTWVRKLADGGEYRLEWDGGNGRWAVSFYDEGVNGEYEKDGDVWKNSQFQSYTVAWDGETLKWTLVKGENGVLDYAVPWNVSDDGVSLTLDADGTGIELTAKEDESGDAVVSGDFDVSGAYSPSVSSDNPMEREWRKTVEGGYLSLEYSKDGHEWLVVPYDTDANGLYQSEKEDATGTERRWSRTGREVETGERATYVVSHDGEAWTLSSSEQGELSRTLSPSEDPYGVDWTTGEVKDPYGGAGVYHAKVSFTMEEDAIYDLFVTNTSSSQSFCGKYTLEDAGRTGRERKWANGEGQFVRFVSDRWVVTSNENSDTLEGGDWGGYSNDIFMYASREGNEDVKDPSSIPWTGNTSYHYESHTATLSSEQVLEYGERRFWIAVGEKTVGGYATSLVSSFRIRVQQYEISGTVLELYGADGNRGYTGFVKDADGGYTPTDLVTVKYGAVCPYPVRVSFNGGIDTGGAETRYSGGIVTQTAMLAASILGGADVMHEISMEIRDEAGNMASATDSIVHISRLWRMEGTNIRKDDAGYSTKVYSAAGGLVEIPRETVSETETYRKWGDIFHPSNHGYPTGDDGEMDVEEATRVSRPTDATGKNGPTLEELKRYDRLSLNRDGSLKLDEEGRASTEEWQDWKRYSPMESSTYGKDGSNLSYWVIDNTGYNEINLEFEYFDLDSSESSIPPNMLSPYKGDTLVVYDAQADGCLTESRDEYGRVKWTLSDSSKLVEVFAFGGSYKDRSICFKSDTQGTIELTGNGFVAPPITSTARVCIVLYTDNDYEGSGFKVKAGARRNVSYLNYEIDHATGELWVHSSPKSAGTAWGSPAKVSTTHRYFTSNAVVDHEAGKVTLDRRQSQTITGNFTAYSYLGTDGSAVAPTTNFTYSNGVGQVRPALKTFALYHDDCLDYREVSTCVVPIGTAPVWNGIYSPTDASKDKGKVTSGVSYNKDKGIVYFNSAVPLGRMFSSYTYHTFLRLSGDGYGDLTFYDSALVPTENVSGISDWTYVDLVVCNEGTTALSDGIIKFMSRGYLTGSGDNAVVTEVIDENRPWDVQAGTVAETVNCTGCAFSASFNSLPKPDKENALSTIGSSTGGGTSLGTMFAPRSKAYLRVFWSLAKSGDGGAGYVATTRGEKLWSSELSGKYYVVTV